MADSHEPYMVAGIHRPVRIYLGDTLEADVAQLTLEDIATSLARLGRYNGHGSRFYSVLEHSLLLARFAESSEMTAAEGFPAHALARILTRSPAWDLIKTRVTWAIYDKYIRTSRSSHLLRLAAELDRRIVANEMSALWQLPKSVADELPERLAVAINPHGPTEGFLVTKFLRLARKLGIEEPNWS